MNNITLSLIKLGLKRGLIKPVLDDELKCYIGEYWFWFGGTEFEYTDPKEIPEETLAEEIYNALDSMKDEFEDEYEYYYYFLTERTGFYNDKYYVSTCPDVGENKGGYFVEIFTDENLDNRIDYFCIHPEELKMNPDISYWIKEYLKEE